MAKRAVWILGFALFSLFFGAGNLILPPQLGLRSGELWWLVCLGFGISAVLIPMFGILAHARLQGGIFDFGKKVSPGFSLVFSYLIYAIAITLPSPRTAAVTHEMAIAPYLGTGSLGPSLVYFGLVFVLAMNRARLSSLIGKWLTPLILLALMLLIGSSLLWPAASPGPSALEHPLTAGILEGYQTFDAIGALVVGGVILVSLRLEQPQLEFRQRFRAVASAGLLAGLFLLILYAGLILSGAHMQGMLEADSSRTELLTALSAHALGGPGGFVLSVLIALACFTTAVGIVTGTADFFAERFGDSKRVFVLTTLAGCLLGVGIGQMQVDYIIAVAVPALMFIYPLTIILILLNAMPSALTPVVVFRAVVIATSIFSIPDFLESVGTQLAGNPLVEWIPLREFRLAWLLPAVVTYGAGSVWIRLKRQPGQWD